MASNLLAMASNLRAMALHIHKFDNGHGLFFRNNYKAATGTVVDLSTSSAYGHQERRLPMKHNLLLGGNCWLLLARPYAVYVFAKCAVSLKDNLTHVGNLELTALHHGVVKGFAERFCYKVCCKAGPLGLSTIERCPDKSKTIVMFVSLL